MKDINNTPETEEFIRMEAEGYAQHLEEQEVIKFTRKLYKQKDKLAELLGVEL